MKKILLGVLAAFALTALGVPAYAGDEKKKDEAAPAEKPDKKSPEAKKSKKGGANTGGTTAPK